VSAPQASNPVTRYRVDFWEATNQESASASMAPSPDGPWVKYEDYVRLLGRLSAARLSPETPDDAARLGWVMRNVSGAEWRRLGVLYGDAAGIRQAIDVARSSEKTSPEPQGRRLVDMLDPRPEDTRPVANKGE
jgi:hypothetical protein